MFLWKDAHLYFIRDSTSHHLQWAFGKYHEPLDSADESLSVGQLELLHRAALINVIDTRGS